jgi:hypothetical protein
VQTLNVILHGLFALEERDGHIIALAPDLNGEHVYRAGSWLGEIELRRGDYWLLGVEHGRGRFAADRNLILPKARFSAQAPRTAFASIVFPQPRDVISLRTLAVTPGDFTGSSSSAVTTNKIATIQILVYDVNDLRDVELSGHPWKVPSDPDLSTYNLHVFAEEDVEVGEGGEPHSLAAFSRTLALYGLDLSLVAPKTTPPLSAEDRALMPPGIDALEVGDLPRQVSHLGGFGDVLREFLRQSTPDHLAALGRFWTAAEGIGTGLSRCSFVIGRSA